MTIAIKSNKRAILTPQVQATMTSPGGKKWINEALIDSSKLMKSEFLITKN